MLPSRQIEGPRTVDEQAGWSLGQTWAAEGWHVNRHKVPCSSVPHGLCYHSSPLTIKRVSFFILREKKIALSQHPKTLERHIKKTLGGRRTAEMSPSQHFYRDENRIETMWETGIPLRWLQARCSLY